MVELFLELFLNQVPALLSMRCDALGAVLKPVRKDTEVTRAGKEKERTVAKETGLPVIKSMARKKFACRIDKVFVVHK